MLGETSRSIMDPCRNIAAEATIMRIASGYATGSPTRGFTLMPPGQRVSYVESMLDPKYRIPGGVLPPPGSPPPRKITTQLLTVTTK